MLNFGRDAEILEEALMCRPELPPHCLAHTMLGIDEVCSGFKLLTCLNPLQPQPTDTCRNNNTRLMAFFQDNLDKPAPECLHSGLYRSKDDGGRW